MSVTAEATIERANALVGFRRMEEARDLVKQAIASEPDVDRLWSTLAWIEKQREDYKATIVAAKRALGIEPTNAVAMHALVAAYELTGKRYEARKIADQMVATYPNWVDGLVQRAFIYSRWDGKYAPSGSSTEIVMASLQHAVELAPEHASTLAYSAVYYSAILRADLGRPLMERALELSPTDEEIILLSKTFADEQGQIDRDLAVLAENPLSVMARTGFDEKLWSRATTLVAIPLWTAAIVVIIAHIFYDSSGPWLRLILGGGAVIAFLSMGSIVRRTTRMFPANILRSIIRQNRLVTPSLIATAVTSAVILVTSLVLSFAPVERSDQFFRDAISALAVAAFVQSLVMAAISFTIARVDIGSMRYADTPAGKVALKRQSGNIASAFIGVFGAFCVSVLSVFTSELTSVFAVVSIAVLCLSWTFTDLGANAYRRSAAYPTLWLAIVLYLIAFVIYVLAGMLVFEQLFARLD